MNHYSWLCIARLLLGHLEWLQGGASLKQVQRWPEHNGRWSSAAIALYTAADLLCFLFTEALGSNAGFVTVEGRDVKHVAVCANPDGLHLSVSGQGSRVGGAARAKNLKGHKKHKRVVKLDKEQKLRQVERRRSYLAAASAVMLSADDGEGSLAGDADAAGFIRHPVRRVYGTNGEGIKRKNNGHDPSRKLLLHSEKETKRRLE